MTGSALTTASQHSLLATARALERSHLEPVDRRSAFPGSNADQLLFRKRSNPSALAPPEIVFGPFRLLPTQFLLLEGDKPVPLGSRALEILAVLLERPGELVSKQELMGRVWPKIFVEPANLTVHMSALRRMLHDGHDGNRFIINVPGRGYSFVASVEVLGPRIERERPSRGLNEPAVALPDRRLSMSGKRNVAVITDPVGPNRQRS